MKNLFYAVVIGTLFGAVIAVADNWDKLVLQTPVPKNTIRELFQEVPDAKLNFTAPDSCVIGELVKFDVSHVLADSFKWSIRPETDDFVVVEGGTKAFFSGREPGTYLVIVAAANDGQVDLFVDQIKVLEDGNVDHFVARWLKRVKYPEVARKREKVQALAAVYYSLATENATPDEFLVRAAEPTTKVLAEDLELWKPFLIALSEYLDKKTKAGHLQTTEDYQSVWKEIADALTHARVE